MVSTAVELAHLLARDTGTYGELPAKRANRHSSSKPVRSGNPRPARFDSGAAPLSRKRLSESRCEQLAARAGRGANGHRGCSKPPDAPRDRRATGARSGPHGPRTAHPAVSSISSMGPRASCSGLRTGFATSKTVMSFAADAQRFAERQPAPTPPNRSLRIAPQGYPSPTPRLVLFLGGHAPCVRSLRHLLPYDRRSEVACLIARPSETA